MAKTSSVALLLDSVKFKYNFVTEINKENILFLLFLH